MYTQGQKFGITVKVFKRNMHVQQGMDSAEVSAALPTGVIGF